jgi:hypothetical protein
MPRYYFHVREHDVFREDPEGTELPSDDLAYEEAIFAAREILSEKVLHGGVIDGQVFEIMNDAGELVHKLPLKAVIRIE